MDILIQVWISIGYCFLRGIFTEEKKKWQKGETVALAMKGLRFRVPGEKSSSGGQGASLRSGTGTSTQGG